MNNSDAKHLYTEDEKKKAAYALNLCAVSVSQIIDYGDANILDQEYDVILNNLNLEQMPKDDPLLDIFKKILDVVTYFKTSEGDKRMIDKEYQHRMKNAIWTAIPNISAFFTGNWIAMGTALATQVGTGYMNYRRNRSEYALNKEKSEWELQKSAMEQMNGLLKELFETEWRLIKEYNFSDAYRITDRQIHEYNSILMEKHPIKRFEKLHAIKDQFNAYPPFWYYLGNTAHNVYCDKMLSLAEATRLKYRESAIESFEIFDSLNRFHILRYDIFTSSWALEYIDLLNMNSAKDKEKAKQLAAIAEQYADISAYDVLEFCAFAYLKIGDDMSAARVFKKLVYSDYNIPINANMLSLILIQRSRDPQYAAEVMFDYDKLKCAVDTRYLLPMPDPKADLNKWNPQWSRELGGRDSATQSKSFADLANLIGDRFGIQQGSLKTNGGREEKEELARARELRKNQKFVDTFLEKSAPTVVRKTVIGAIYQSNILFTTCGVRYPISSKEVAFFSYHQIDFSRTSIIQKKRGAFGTNLYTKNGMNALYLPISQPAEFLDLLQKASTCQAANADTEKTIEQMPNAVKLVFSKILLLFSQRCQLNWVEAVRFAYGLGISIKDLHLFMSYARVTHEDHELINLVLEFKSLLPYPNEERIACSLIQDLVGLISFSTGRCRDITVEETTCMGEIAHMLHIEKEVLDKLIPAAQIPYRALQKDITMHEIEIITEALAGVPGGFVPVSMLVDPLASRSLDMDLKELKFDWYKTKGSLKKQLEAVRNSYISLYQATKKDIIFSDQVMRAAAKAGVSIESYLQTESLE